MRLENCFIFYIVDAPGEKVKFCFCEIKIVIPVLFLVQALGRSRTAEVKRDATIGSAVASMETLIKQSLANEELTKSKLDNATQVSAQHEKT